MSRQGHATSGAKRGRIESPAEARRWYDEGRTYRWMAEEHLRKYGVRVAPTSFSELRFREGWPARIKKDVDLIPWAVKPEHRWHYYLIQLRAEGRRRKGQDLDPHVEANLNAFLRDLRENDAVVHYDPDTEDGFFLVHRQPSDIDIVRKPATITARKPRD